MGVILGNLTTAVYFQILKLILVFFQSCIS